MKEGVVCFRNVTLMTFLPDDVIANEEGPLPPLETTIRQLIFNEGSTIGGTDIPSKVIENLVRDYNLTYPWGGLGVIGDRTLSTTIKIVMRVSDLRLEGLELKGDLKFSLKSDKAIHRYFDLIDMLKEGPLSFVPVHRISMAPTDDGGLAYGLKLITFAIDRGSSGGAPFPLTFYRLLEALRNPEIYLSATGNELPIIPLEPVHEEEPVYALSKEQISDAQLEEMLVLQDEMNSVIRADWKENPFPYIDAVIIEGAEAREHYGWKWWKKQEPDLDQVRMELVDIWHFYLSEIIIAVPDSLEEQLEEIRSLGGLFCSDPNNFLEAIDRIIGDATYGNYNLKAFSQAMEFVDFSWQELCLWYFGKNMLNLLRQNHGYNEGTYRKQWGEKEDNVVLVEFLKSLDTGQEYTKDSIYEALEVLYLKSVG